MKIIRFREKTSGRARYGVLADDEVKCLEGDPYGRFSVGVCAGGVRDVTLLSPCLPGKVVALASNYRGATGVTENMREPVVFLKPASSVTGPYDDIVFPFKDVKAWGESELAIVVGKQLRKASIPEAKNAIFGYVCANDVTAENVDGRDHHLARSKAADTFCPIGPWIDTDFVPGKAAIEAYQNQKLIRTATLDNRIWKDEETLQWLSQWMTLDAGDIVLTGTPPRVVEKTFLSDGDIFEVKISGLGALKNRFIIKAGV